jgi:AraC-like DNA-binding protein
MAAFLRPGEILRMVDELITVGRAALSIGAVDVLRGRHLRHPSAAHMHDFFAIGIIDGGKVRVRYRRSEACASAGAIITISAGEMHAGAPVGDSGWSYRMIYPQRGLFRAALENELDDDETLLFPSPFVVDADVCRLFHSAFTNLVAADCSLAGEERLLALFRVLAARHSARPPRTVRVGRAARVVETARSYLHAHFADNVQLSTLASICGVSPFHLIRLFRRQFGLPPHAYLKQVRVGHALGLLREGVLVSQVAYSCGFSDQSHLTRSFKRTFGVTPGAYQRAVRTDMETRRTA